MILMTALWLLVILLLLRHLRGGDSRGQLPPGWTAETEREMARLREEVDRLGREVARLNDEQSFMVRLLETRERPSLAPGPDPPERPTAVREDEA
jgi:hypothetical protein